MRVRGLLSLVMVVASQSFSALSLFEVLFKCAAVLPMCSQSAPPSSDVSDGERLRWSLASLLKTRPCGHFSVGKDVVLLGDMGVHYLGDGSGVRISLAADDEIVSWQERLAHA